MASLFYLGDKDLEEIQLIVISIKAVNLVKYVIGIIENLAIMAREKRSQ